MKRQPVKYRSVCEAEALEAVEAESQRIACELHDAVGQELAAAALFTAGLQKLVERTRRKISLRPALRRSPSIGSAAAGDSAGNDHSDELPHEVSVCHFNSAETTRLLETITGIRRALAAAARSVRDLSHGLLLTELEPSQLADRLKELQQSLESTHSVHCDIRCPEPGQPGFELLNPQRALQLFRIVQEAVSNAIRHGGADCIRISLSGNACYLELKVSDNGHGMDCERLPCHDATANGATHGGIGLRNMAYRARRIGGSLQIKCCSGGGTTIRCRIKPQESQDG